MVQVPALAILLVGIVIGIMIGVIGIVVCAFKFNKGDENNGKKNN